MPLMRRLELNELCIMDESQIEDSGKIYATLLQGFHCIFFTNENNKLTGILTVEDYNRNSSINNKYTYLIDSETSFEQAKKIFKDRPGIYDIPVVDKDNGALCYVIQRINNEMVDFLYDWEIMDMNHSIASLNRFTKIYLFYNCDKTDGFVRHIKKHKEIVHMVNEDQLCQIGDSDLVITSYTLRKPTNAKYTIMGIDELYLSLLGNYTVDKLKSNGINYFFFQAPLDFKLRFENRVYYVGNIVDIRYDNKSLDDIYNDDDISKQYWTSGEYKNVKLVKIGERFMLGDSFGETYNVQNNLRHTQSNPKTFDRTIWVFGTCVVRGFGVSDAKTIPSILQNLLLTNGVSNIRVINFGGGGGMNDFSDIRDFINILHTNISKNDIVVHIGFNVWDKPLSAVGFEQYYELSWLLNRKHTQRLFLDYVPHLTSYANRVIAEYIFDVLVKDSTQSVKE